MPTSTSSAPTPSVSIHLRAAGRGRWIHEVRAADGSVLLATNDLRAALREVRRAVCATRAAIVLDAED